MIRSMTGYGEAERSVATTSGGGPGGRLRVEIRTVNHRFLNTSFRTPPGWDRWEPRLQARLREHLSRGHATVSVSFELETAAGADPSFPELDLDRARHVLGLLERMTDALDLPSARPDAATLARLGDVLRRPDARSGGPSRTADPDEAELDAAVDDAARAVVTMREAEGARLRDDMEGRLEAMSAALERVRERAPERLRAERDRLREAVRELSGQEEVDEDRLAREIAYLAEKWDIHEELVRFTSHVELFREALDADAADPVGKRLSFLVQEMHREANTIGAKANDAAIAEASVSLKEEIERLREQVENVE